MIRPLHITLYVKRLNVQVSVLNHVYTYPKIAQKVIYKELNEHFYQGIYIFSKEGGVFGSGSICILKIKVVYQI